MSQSDFVSRGQALVAAGQFQEAVKVCRLGLLGRPTTVEGRVVLGQALLALKRFDEVLAEMRVALELDHSSIAAQALKAEALLRKGDTHAAIEALHKARQASPGDPRILQLLGEAESQGGRAAVSTSHPAVGFVGSGDTKHYPNHATSNGDEDSGGGYTKPTSVAAPASIRRTSEKHAAVLGVPERTPSPAVLAIGDRSGTVEVDPELEGVEMDDELDFDDLASPPVAKAPAKIGGDRGSVKSSGGRAKSAAKQPAKARAGAARPPTMDLEVEDSDVVEVPRGADAKRRPPGPGTAVRNAVQMPSGPLDAPRGKPVSAPPLAHSIAAQPHFVQVSPLPPTPQPLPPAPRGPIAAAMPTVAGAPPPPFAPASPAATRPTMAMPQQQAAAGVDAMFGSEQSPWARANGAAPAQLDPRSIAAANEPTARPDLMDPVLAALMSTPSDGAAVAYDAPSAPAKPAMRTGMRKARSRLQFVMWILIGILVIGGGVVAGFQIRAMRLRRQIAQARDHALELAKADTWSGWGSARDSFAGIVQASRTLENRAALGHARGVIAFEFGDGLAEAKTSVDQLAGQGGLEGDLAMAYLALAQNDPKSAKLAADAAISAAPKDAAALYVSGEASLLAGDAKAAVDSLKHAVELDARPLYGVGLAYALASTNAWDEAIGAVDRVLSASKEHPAAVIARGMILASSGRLTAGSPVAADVRGQLDRIIAEGRMPPGQQQHGVSPAQVAFADLALAQVDFARGDLTGARNDVRSAAGVAFDDQRFAEEAVETLYLLGELPSAKSMAENALTSWPASRRTRIALAQISLALGKPGDALDILAKQPDVIALPLAQAIRGEAHLATGDLDSARADFEGALKKLPTLEPALVGRAWHELASGNADEALKLIEPHYKENASSPAVTVVYAAALRGGGDLAKRDKAKGLLDKVVAGPPGLAVARARLELARLDRDVGDFHAARVDYGEASKTGNFDARLETGLLYIEDRDPLGGRDTLDLLLKEAGDHPSATLVLEVIRARMLAGDHVGAAQLIETADKLPGVLKWKLERERGRLALRKGDFAGASQALGRALEGSGDDAETLLLAADAATADEKSGLAERVKKLAADRLKGRPEAGIVSGKLLIGLQKDAEAEPMFRAAKEQLKNAKASARRVAQADYGLAVIAYDRQNVPDATTDLELVMNDDPSIADAYLYAALVWKDPKKQFELAQKAVRFNPDSAAAWAMLGQRAHKLGDKKTLADAIGKLGTLAPTSQDLKDLQALRGR